MIAQRPFDTTFRRPLLGTSNLDFYLRFLSGEKRDLIAVVKRQADQKCALVKVDVQSSEQLQQSANSSPATVGRVASRIEGIALSPPCHFPAQQRSDTDQRDNILTHGTYMLQALCSIWFSAHTFRDRGYCNAVIDAILQLPNLGQCAIRAITEWEVRALFNMETARHLEEDTPLLRLLVDCVAAATTPEEMKKNLLDYTWSLSFGSKMTLRIWDFDRYGVMMRVPSFENRRTYYIA